MFGGVIVGLLIGSTALTLVVLGGLFSIINANRTPLWGFVTSYVLGAAIGACGIVLTRRRAGFWSGLLIGSGIGLLGGTTLCNAVTSGLGAR